MRPGGSNSAFDVLMAGATKQQRQRLGMKKRPSPHKNVEAVGELYHDDDGGSEKKKKMAITSVVNMEKKLAESKSKAQLLKTSPNSFDPKLMACCFDGKRMPFLLLCQVFEIMTNENSTNLLVDIACNMLRTLMHAAPDDIVAVVDLFTGKVSELGIGEHCVIKALAEAYGMLEKEVCRRYKLLGDLGLVAETSRSSQSVISKPHPLTVAKVFDVLRLIAEESGKDSRERKKKHIKSLLVAASGCEPKYLIRLLLPKNGLRINFKEAILRALGRAAVYNENCSTPTEHIQSEAVKLVKQAYSIFPVYEKIVLALLNGGVWNLPNTISFKLGVPISPMLANRANDISDIVKRFHGMEYTCEYKYDGERAQIHCMEGGIVELYSRNLKHSTEKYPDAVIAVSRYKKPSVKSFVLDCEIVAYDRSKRKILPFQTLSTRGRKNVDVEGIKVNACIFAFDMLYLNGQLLIKEQLKVRREHLYDSFVEGQGVFQFATALNSSKVEDVQNFMDSAINASCEGLVFKTLSLHAMYEPEVRSDHWVKLKKDYMEGLGDSLDLVPIAAYNGRGKRTGFYGKFLLACYDCQNGEFQSICKLGTGFSEQRLQEFSSRLNSKVIPKPKPYYRYDANKTANPDVWFEPSEVWEVKASDLTISPVYCAAIGRVDSDKGVSLRSPRLLRVREDKDPEQASTSKQI